MDQDRHRKLQAALRDILESVQRSEGADPGPSLEERRIRRTATLAPNRHVSRSRWWIPLTLILFVVVAAFSWRAGLRYTGQELVSPEVRADASLRSAAPGPSSRPVEPLEAPEQIVPTSSPSPVKPEKLRAHPSEPEQATVGESGPLASETQGVSTPGSFAERSTETLLTHSTETNALAKSAPSAPSDPKGGFFVQVAAHRTEQRAEAQFQVMQSKYPTILGGREPIIYRKDLGSKGIYWRTWLGPFASREDATRLCNDLKAAGGKCFVQRKDRIFAGH
jgi:hypothetical protein